MARRIGLRGRVLALFATTALGSSAVVIGGLWLAARRVSDPEALHGLALAGGVSVAAILGLSVWAWLRVDEQGVKPLAALARTMQTVAHSGTSGAHDPAASAELGEIGTAAGELSEALRTARADLATARAEAAAAAEAQKARLEAVLRDLEEAVVICTPSHRVVLLNRRAVELLGAEGEIGLGRPLSGVLALGPFDHALERLRRARGRNESRTGDGGETRTDAPSTTVVCTTRGGGRTFLARVGLVEATATADGIAPAGYVVTFRDITSEMTAHANRDRLLADVLDLGRRVAANISTTLDVAMTTPELGPEDRRSLEEAAAAEAFRLSARVRELATIRDEEVAAHWPMDDVLTSDLFESARLRLGPAAPAIEGAERWTRCDSLSVVALLSRIVARLDAAGAADIAVSAAEERNRLFLDLLWPGVEPAMRDIEAWLAEPLEDAPGGLTGREILNHHHSDLWPDRAPDGRARLRLPLSLSEGAGERVHMPARPEFYDFGIDDRALPAEITETPLADLAYVAFDCETTGLEPQRGDEIVQIAGVRIVNGRVLAGEAFDTLVDPGRSIPPLSTKIHGISEEMVRGAPTAPQALRRFHAYTADAVLIAHNAPFDMAFLRREGRGVTFDNPVLDTVLLSAFLHDHTGQHSLDDLAMRFDVTIDPHLRHTALGDARATAQVFVRLLPLLTARGVTTLGTALEASGEMRAIRRAQARYG